MFENESLIYVDDLKRFYTMNNIAIDEGRLKSVFFDKYLKKETIDFKTFLEIFLKVNNKGMVITQNTNA